MSVYDGSFESAAESLARLVERSVSDSVRGLDRVAVAFSGGLDSSVLVTCAKKLTEVVACSASSAGAADDRNPAAAAREMGVEISEVRLTRASVTEALRNMDLPFEPSLMDKGLWSLYYLVSERAAREGAREILLGQMSDELFAGYAKYEKAYETGGGKAESIMTEDLALYAEKGRRRDLSACERWLPARFPFGANEIVEFGLRLPLSYKLRAGERKAVLRRAALILGVPATIAAAPKKAAQYSSGIQKLL